MLANLAEQLIRHHFSGAKEETILHIVATLRVAEAGVRFGSFDSETIDVQAERRRAKDRERKRLVRSGVKSVSSADLSADNEDKSADIADPSFPSSPTPLITLTTISKIKTPSRLADGWKPNDEHRRYAVELGLDEAGMLAEAARMADWAAAKDERRSNWDAFFSYWLRNGAPKAFKSHAGGKSRNTKIDGEAKSGFVPNVVVLEGTLQWEAWVAAGHKRSLKHHYPKGAGWIFVSEWPPESIVKAS